MTNFEPILREGLIKTKLVQSQISTIWKTFMEEQTKKSTAAIKDREIVFSKAIRAGKRIYYLDVKKNRREELFLSITESKKIVYGEGENLQVSFEKHKIFLYKEDFEKFFNGLQESINYIEHEQGHFERKQEPVSLSESLLEDKDSISETNDEIKIDIDF